MIFSRNKVSIKKDKVKDGFKYYVKFGWLKNKKEFKIKLIRELFQGESILSVIDTSLMYSETDNEELSERIKMFCDKYSVKCKTIKIKKEDRGVFGVKIIRNKEVSGFDYIFGLMLDGNRAEIFSDIFNEFNLSFYSAENSDILENFDLDYRHKEYDLNVFIDNFMNTAAICSKKEKEIQNYN